MNHISITSNYGHIHIGIFYVGWSNHPRLPVNNTDCGDEVFGISVGNYYIGHYSDGSWCSGFLNEYGCLE